MCEDEEYISRKDIEERALLKFKEFLVYSKRMSQYLAPLSSKPQALGLALYYIWENGLEKPMSIIYPFCERYIGDTATGIARVWRYEVE